MPAIGFAKVKPGEHRVTRIQVGRRSMGSGAFVDCLYVHFGQLYLHKGVRPSFLIREAYEAELMKKSKAAVRRNTQD